MNNVWLCGARNSPATTGFVGYQDYQCPSTFTRFHTARAWTRIDKEGAPGLTSVEVFEGDGLEDISLSTGASIRQNKAGRVVYIGAGSAEEADTVIKKLDIVFNYHVSHLATGTSLHDPPTPLPPNKEDIS